MLKVVVIPRASSHSAQATPATPNAMYTHMYLHSSDQRLEYSHDAFLLESLMHFTRAFRNGNSQAVRIPAELAYANTDLELEIERIGDEIRIRPRRRPLTGVLDKFARFGDDVMAEGRGDQEQSDREAL